MIRGGGFLQGARWKSQIRFYYNKEEAEALLCLWENDVSFVDAAEGRRYNEEESIEYVNEGQPFLKPNAQCRSLQK